VNGNYYQNPTFPTIDDKSNIITPPGNINYTNTIPMEQSYIENILRQNKGKRINAYVSYPDSSSWQNKVYSGIIEDAGRDHLILSDPTTGNWYLIRLIYLDYAEFMEKINFISI
jgi:spore germination protein Q